MKNTWTVVIPIYNDAVALEKLLNEIELTNLKNGSFIIVDNGSSDQIMLGGKFRDNSKFKFVRTENNLGFGGGIKYGLKFANTEWVGWMPGNLKVHPKELNKIDAIIQLNQYEFIKGARVGRDFKSRIKTSIAGVIQSLVLRKNMLDTGGTPTFITRNYIKHLELSPNDYVFESFVLFTAHKYKLRKVRPKIIYGNRIYGSSHWQRGLKSEIKLMINIYKCVRKLE